MKNRAYLAGFVVLCGCAHAPAPKPVASTPLRGEYYQNLEAGWRLRVVTPVLKSGGTAVHFEGDAEESRTGQGLSVTLRAPDLIGYETSYYSVLPRRGSGVKIKFVSAELHLDKENIPQRQSRTPLFQFPGDARYVRLIYLIRRSAQADHDMAVIATKRQEGLDALTRAVQADPAACKNERGQYCDWIPQGVAVRPVTPNEELP